MGLRIPIRLTAVEQEVVRQNGRPRDLSIDERNVIDAFAEAMVTDLEEAWPVDTGLSRDAWSWVLEIAPGDYTLIILNDVDYVEYIHRAGENPDSPLYLELVPQVVAAYRERFKAAMAITVQATQAKLRPGQQPTSLPGSDRQALLRDIWAALTGGV